MPKVDYKELKENIQDSIYITIEATGTNNYIASSNLITSLKSKKTRFTLFVANDANGNCTLNLNSYGTKNIKDANGNIVKNLKKNIPYNVVYNGQDFILQGKGGGGNAQPSDVLQGKKFTNDNGEQIGNMPNNGSFIKKIDIGTKITIPRGYHDGNGYIETKSMKEQFDIPPGSVLTSDKFYRKGFLDYHNNVLCWSERNKMIARNMATGYTKTIDIKGGNYVSYDRYGLSSDGEYMYYGEFRAGLHSDKPSIYKVPVNETEPNPYYNSIAAGDIKFDPNHDGYIWVRSYSTKSVNVADKNDNLIYSRKFGNRTDDKPNATNLYIKNNMFTYTYDTEINLIEPNVLSVCKQKTEIAELIKTVCPNFNFDDSAAIHYIDDDKQHAIFKYQDRSTLYLIRLSKDLNSVQWACTIPTRLHPEIFERNNTYIILTNNNLYNIDKNSGNIIGVTILRGSSYLYKDANDLYVYYGDPYYCLSKIIFIG